MKKLQYKISALPGNTDSRGLCSWSNPVFCPSPGSAGRVSDLLSRARRQSCPVPFQTPEPVSSDKAQTKGRAQGQGPGLRGIWVSPCPGVGDRPRGPPCARVLQPLPFQNVHFQPQTPMEGRSRVCPGAGSDGGCARPEGRPWSPAPGRAAPLGAAVLPLPGGSSAGRVIESPAGAAASAIVPAGAIVPCSRARALSSPNNGGGEATTASAMREGQAQPLSPHAWSRGSPVCAAGVPQRAEPPAPHPRPRGVSGSPAGTCFGPHVLPMLQGVRTARQGLLLGVTPAVLPPPGTAKGPRGAGSPVTAADPSALISPPSTPMSSAGPARVPPSAGGRRGCARSLPHTRAQPWSLSWALIPPFRGWG